MNRLHRNRLASHFNRVRRWELESDWITRGVLDENVKYRSEEQTGILLWDQWIALLQGATRLGPVLISSRNSHAIVGEFREFPEVIPTADETAAVDPARLLMFQFSPWFQAMAWSERRRQGRLYKVEVVDPAAQPFFRISLTQDSYREAFRELVQTQQGWGLHWEAGRLQQAGCVTMEGLFLPNVGWSQTLATEAFERLLFALCEKGPLLELQVASAGVSQLVRFHLADVRSVGQWLFVAGTTGCAHLHCHELTLRWSGPPAGAAGLWQVQGVREDDLVAFTLTGNDWPESFR